MLSKRIEGIVKCIETIDEAKKHIPIEKIAYEPDENQDILMRKAGATEAFFKTSTLSHIPGSRLAGVGSYLYTPWPPYFIEKDREEIRNYPKQCSDELMIAMEEKMFYLNPYLGGHISANQTYILENGINGMIERIDKRLEDKNLNDKQVTFLKAAKKGWIGALYYADRYSKFYKEMAKEENDAVLKTEYENIAELISRVPANPATTYVEALQAMWFTYRCIHADDNSGHTFGRLDQILYPYYAKDIAEGILTKEDAKEYFLDFWLKFGAGNAVGISEGDRFEFFGNEDEVKEADHKNGLFWIVSGYCATSKHVDVGHPCEIGGLDENGNDATNDISWLALDAIKEIKHVLGIKPILKYDEKVDPKFFKECLDILMDGKALPSIAFEKNTIEALLNEPGATYTKKDLLDICHVGCIETAIHGNSYTEAMNCFLNLPKILRIAMGNGYHNNKKIGVETKPATSFAEFLGNYQSQLSYFIELYTNSMNEAKPFFTNYYVRPMTSTLVEGSIEKALLVDQGGAVHWSQSMECCGVADVADSLMVVKNVVFDDKKMSMQQFNDILDNDFAGNESFREYCLNKVPKYGNGVPEVDQLAKYVADTYCDKVFERRSFEGNIFRPGLYSFYGTTIVLGEATPALPCGRRNGELLSLNIMPEHGMMRNGITSVLQSVTVFDHRKSINACPVDVQLSPNTPVEILEYIIKYLYKHNALLLQVGVVNHQDMVEAQLKPEEYKDLVVRVSGFSAYFVTLDEQTQNEMIERSYWA